MDIFPAQFEIVDVIEEWIVFGSHFDDVMKTRRGEVEPVTEDSNHGTNCHKNTE